MNPAAKFANPILTKISKNKNVYSVINKSGKVIDNLKQFEIGKNLINLAKIPLSKQIFTDKGRLTYYVKGFNKVIDRNTGKVVGYLNKDKRIINKGKLVGKLNDKNILESGLQESLNKGLKLTPDYKISQKIAGKRIFDGSGTVLATLENSKIYNGVKYIMDAQGKGIMGAIDKNGKFIFDWRKNLTKDRVNVIHKFRKELIAELKNGTTKEELIKKGYIHPHTPKEYLDEFIKIGKSGNLQVHHINNVANNPDLAGNLGNLRLTDRVNHLKLHGGNFRNPTTRELIDCISYF